MDRTRPAARDPGARSAYLRYLRESRGTWGVVGEVALRLLRPIYHHQRQAVFLHDVSEDEGTHHDLPVEEQGGQRVECFVLESPALLPALHEEVAADIWPGLERRFEAGRTAVLARVTRPGEASGKIVGYSIWERGVFSALGRKGPVGAHVFFGHYVYVDGDYRGRRIWQRLRSAAMAYGKARGITTTCGVTSLRNRAAIRARTHLGDRRVGVVSRIAVFGMLVWETPWKEIERFLDP